MKRATITVTITEPYVATCGRAKSSATCGQQSAARSCAAKALDLCPLKRPAGTYPSEYYRMIEKAEGDVRLRRIDDTTFEATRAPWVQEGGAA